MKKLPKLGGAVFEKQQFGYLPNTDNQAALRNLGQFDMALVINGPAGAFFDATPNVRYHSDPAVELPEGLYWFASDSASLVVYVGDSNVQRSGAMSATHTELHENENHPLNFAYGWACHYWDTALEVPQPKFQAGEAVQHATRGADMLIRSRDFSGGSWQYKVTLDGKPVQLLEVSISPLIDMGDPSQWLTGQESSAEQFGATLSRAKLLGRFANTIYSFRATRTIFRAYQFKPILKLLQTGKSRILIADEVGLGKTIEAGLVWTELEARKEADRVFIVCPASLVSKWKREMEERFGFELREFDKASMDEFIEKLERDKLPNRFAYIASIERLRTWSGMEFISEFPFQLDLLIMDEAHAMRNTSTKNYATGAVMSQLSTAAVFLTATPINLRRDDVLSLTGLLAPEDELEPETAEAQLEPNRYLNQIASLLGKPNPDSVQLLSLLQEVLETPYGALTAERSEFLALELILKSSDLSPAKVVEARRYIADLNALATVISRTRKAEVDERKTVREARKVEVQWTAEELDFYKEFLIWCQAKAKRSGSHLLFSMQMPLRLASACLAVTREFVLSGALQAESIIDSDDVQVSKPSTYDDVTPSLIAAARALPKNVDTKRDELAKILAQLHLENRRALLFTFSKPTLSYLAKTFGDRYKIAILNGDVPHAKRNEIMKQFREGVYDFVFANRVASEGLDFEFCSAVINYDLPWNPMEVEQRIGRIDRIGQPEAKILIINFYNDETVDERIMIRLLERIKIFEETIGELEPIIHEHMKEIWGSLEFDLDADQLEQKVHQVEIALENQKSLLSDVSESASELFVSNDVDIDGLEDELLRSGRYVGQTELANLIVDWAETDGGSAEQTDQMILVKGSPRMAERLTALSEKGLRTRSETERLSAALRDELPIALALEPELARTDGQNLINANHPMVMAAVSVPVHRQAKFANVQIHTDDLSIAEGTYAVIIAVAKNASRGGDELWGDACDVRDLSSATPVFDLLLSTLANGGLLNRTDTFETENAQRAVTRMMNRMNERHAHEQSRRQDESEIFRRSRELALFSQHEKKIASISSRIDALVDKGANESVIRMFEGQLKAATRMHDFHMSKVAERSDPSIEIEYLAVCILGVKHGQQIT